MSDRISLEDIPVHLAWTGPHGSLRVVRSGHSVRVFRPGEVFVGAGLKLPSDAYVADPFRYMSECAIGWFRGDLAEALGGVKVCG